jgi:hypothetical protein
MAEVFNSETGLANEWMKGLLSSSQIIDEMGIQIDRRFRDDFLARRLDFDCARMRVNAELFELLRLMRAEATVVEDGQPVPGGDQFGHRAADVGIEVVPYDHQRAGELVVRGIQQGGVVGLGEAFPSVVAAGTSAVDPVDQPGPAPGPDGDQRGQGHARVVRSGHRDHGGAAAPSPGSALGRT